MLRRDNLGVIRECTRIISTALTWTRDAEFSNETATLPTRVLNEKCRKACVISDMSNVFTLMALILPSRNNCMLSLRSLSICKFRHMESMPGDTNLDHMP